MRPKGAHDLSERSREGPMTVACYAYSTKLGNTVVDVLSVS